MFRSIPPFYGVPLHSCRYAAHPRVSSPLGSHVIERSPSRGETQPIHILCSLPVYLKGRKRQRDRDGENNPDYGTNGDSSGKGVQEEEEEEGRRWRMRCPMGRPFHSFR